MKRKKKNLNELLLPQQVTRAPRDDLFRDSFIADNITSVFSAVAKAHRSD